jgi:hypothetical protein
MFEMLLLQAGSQAVDTLARIMNGERPEPKLAHAAARAAVAVLEHCGHGPPCRRKASKTA